MLEHVYLYASTPRYVYTCCVEECIHRCGNEVWKEMGGFGEVGVLDVPLSDVMCMYIYMYTYG